MSDSVLPLVFEKLNLVDACSLLSVSKRFATLRERHKVRRLLSEREFKEYFSQMSGRMTYALDLEKGVRESRGGLPCCFDCKDQLPVGRPVGFFQESLAQYLEVLPGDRKLPLQPLSYKYFEPYLQISEVGASFFELDLYLKKHLGRSHGDVLTDFQFSLFAKRREGYGNKWRQVDMHPDLGDGTLGKNTTSTHIFDEDENGFEGIVVDRQLWDLSDVRLVVSVDILATNIKLGLGPLPGSTLGLPFEEPVVRNFSDRYVRNSFFSKTIVKPSHVVPSYVIMPEFGSSQSRMDYKQYLRKQEGYASFLNSFLKKPDDVGFCLYGQRLCSKNIIRPKKEWVAHSELVQRYEEVRLKKIKYAASFVLSASDYCVNKYKFFLVAMTRSDHYAYHIEEKTRDALGPGDYECDDDDDLDASVRHISQKLGIRKGFGLDVLYCHVCGESIRGCYIKVESSRCIGSCCFSRNPYRSKYKKKIRHERHYRFGGLTDLTIFDEPGAQI